MKWIIVFYLTLVRLTAGNQTCMDFMSTVTLKSTGYVYGGAGKASVIAESKLDCIAYCYFKGFHIALTYDPDTQKCKCYSVELTSLETLAPAAVFYEVTDETKQAVLADTVDTWISTLIGVSSEYSFTVYDYGGHNVIGAPNVYPSYGNTDNAWCPNYLDADQFIELGIPEAIYITEIHIYEVFWAGGVESVSVRDSNYNWVSLWSTSAVSAIEESRIFVPNFVDKGFLWYGNGCGQRSVIMPIAVARLVHNSRKPPPFKSDAVRLDLDLATINNWSEFDAVRVIGTRTRWRV